MGHASRKKKRQIKQGREVQREKYQDRHYLTVNQFKTCCNDCAKILLPDDEMVFRYRPRQILCVRCAEVAGVKARPSVSWEKRHKTKKVPGPLRERRRKRAAA